MSPVYEEDGKWWFNDSDGIVGPFDTEDDAWKVYRITPKRSCPSCEE